MAVSTVLTRRSLFIGLVVLVSYLSVCVYFWATQAVKILAPLSLVATNPERMGMPYERVEVPLYLDDQGVHDRLDAFWIPVEDPDAPVFLYLHGQDATIGKNLEHAERLYQWGWNVLVVDYRGFGKSYGYQTPSELKVYQDALAALRYLKYDRQFLPEKIFLFGHSLGGAVAIELATHEESEALAGIIVESTFTSVQDMSAIRYRGLLRLLPVGWLLTERFDSLSKIDSVTLPKLFFHGDQDSKIPVEMTEKLYNAARGVKRKCIIQGADHANCGSIGKVQYRQQLEAFVAECLDLANHKSRSH
jgi:alpha-beta hydrolase superfamily lysophospholipase